MLHVRKHEAPRPSCLLRKQRQHRPSQSPATNRKSSMAGKTSNFLGAGRSTEKEFCLVEPRGGRGEQSLDPDFVVKSTKGEYKPGLLFASATIKGFERS